MEEEAEEDIHKVVETDPTGRFERYNISLGKGAFKEVFKAFDSEEGVEVAWNQLRLDNFVKKDINTLLSEIRILESLRNENIINFFHSWIHKSREGKQNVVFITELMTSGTLKSYIKKSNGNVKPKVLKNWCRQILSGLLYLHTRDPPIIHRDLKCENIFINGNNGQAKIGDLGLATIKSREHMSSVLGTPEFMAPELYDESYDEKVDIYAFGMVILEIATGDYPYSECTNQAQIYKKVSSGVKPLALQKISDEATRAFVDLCIVSDRNIRPSAAELFHHPFLNSSPSAINIVSSAPGSNSSLENCVDDAIQAGLGITVPPAYNPSAMLLEPDRIVASVETIDSQLSNSDISSHSRKPSTPTVPIPILPSFDSMNKKDSSLSPDNDYILAALSEAPKIKEALVEADSFSFQVTQRAPVPELFDAVRQDLPSNVQPIIVHVCERISDTEVLLKMIRVTKDGETAHEIKFPFDLYSDTVTDVVSEMVNENLINAGDEQLSRRKIEEAIREILLDKKNSANDLNNSTSENESILYDAYGTPIVVNNSDIYRNIPVSPRVSKKFNTLPKTYSANSLNDLNHSSNSIRYPDSPPQSRASAIRPPTSPTLRRSTTGPPNHSRVSSSTPPKSLPHRGSLQSIGSLNNMNNDVPVAYSTASTSSNSNASRPVTPSDMYNQMAGQFIPLNLEDPVSDRRFSQASNYNQHLTHQPDNSNYHQLPSSQQQQHLNYNKQTSLQQNNPASPASNQQFLFPQPPSTNPPNSRLSTAPIQRFVPLQQNPQQNQQHQYQRGVSMASSASSTTSDQSTNNDRYLPPVNVFGTRRSSPPLDSVQQQTCMNPLSTQPPVVPEKDGRSFRNILSILNPKKNDEK